MRVLLYHPVVLPVLHYGGTERVLMWLAISLRQTGHSVAVFAAPGSTLPEGLECITDPSQLHLRAKAFDVVHGFTRLPRELEEVFQGRVLYTIHGNGKKGETFHPNTVFLSQNHAERHGASEYVYNGLDPDELSFLDGPRPARYLFLSKTSWKVKNLRGAYRLARRHQKALWIAGGEGPVDLRWGAWLRKSLGQDWNWLGSVNQKQKAEFLIQGRAMLFPIRWNEPFGLVMAEALVSGTPVLAHPFGSVPELLEFAPQCLMRSSQDWDQALRGEIDLPTAQNCRDWVLSKFDRIQMAKRYVQYYEIVASGRPLHDHAPQTQVTAEEIPLEWLGA